MGSFNNYRREPKAVLIVDRSLREREPGEYSTLVKLPRSGKYDVAFLLDSHAGHPLFQRRSEVKSGAEKKRPQAPFRVESLLADKRIKVGEKLRLRFKLTDPATNEEKPSASVLTFRAGRLAETPVGPIRRRRRLRIRDHGSASRRLLCFFECPSLKVAYVQLPHLVLQALDAASADKTITNAGRMRNRQKIIADQRTIMERKIMPRTHQFDACSYCGARRRSVSSSLGPQSAPLAPGSTGSNDTYA